MKHLEVVAGIIKYEDLILCMQRPVGKYEYVSLKYEFPGGKVESGESNSQALKRELFEEMEMDVNVSESNYFMSVNHVYPDFEITMHAYFCEVDTIDFVMKEHVNHKWLCLDDLDTLDWAPADIPIVKKLMEN
ncbi:MAG: (deoxy)nucleoside triphosphate pyrophosphohydrolase [Oscillospiraceae bacterium]|nr:(deoxy)nucleoside triphosphate pyrophosphohydrolase [Oscillospiraceae bacterium]